MVEMIGWMKGYGDGAKGARIIAKLKAEARLARATR
jgi:hypothetical protein